MEIRSATPDDLEAIVRMAQDFIESTHYRAYVTETVGIRAIAAQLIAAEDARIFLSINAESIPVGMLAMRIYQHPFTGGLVATELAWYVDKDRRGVGVKLLRAAETWARDRGATIMQMIAPDDQVGRFYVAVGYAPVEMVYHKKVSVA